ncbi:hypothetical protein BP6252_13575 [Coleophoma cylindrospora]|uniref:STEEP1 domain-containing protein n=1 Tax=Coleophoma cylindrospora TaxID=1849047 RepID=A0A3D8Q9N2_9HELO|nr:hypothetical protein BP6252_13575 [Coleophoma cylindrospora]
MAIPAATPLPPAIHTYHCLCSTLVLASTHVLSTLPRRAAPSLDAAIILPLPSTLPAYTQTPISTTGSPAPKGSEQETSQENEEAETENELPSEGYTTLLALTPDSKVVVARREDGFERRTVWRCGRCRVVVGYEIVNGENAGGNEKPGRVLYILPGGLMTSEFMKGGKKITEAEVGIGNGVVGKGVWE